MCLLANTDKLKYASVTRLPLSRTARNSAGWCKRLRGSNVNLVERVVDPLPSIKKRGQGQRRLRPFARRRASTRRPLLVAIRARNPWVRARCKLLGLKVRFMRHFQEKLWGKSTNWEICGRRQGY